jgi:GR25 family glycosyltransferase involved in LPS biosynthesis
MATDVAEMTCVTEFSNANVLCVDDIFYTYNYDNSILYPSSYYNSKDAKERELTHKHIKQLPPCNYKLPHIYIINLLEDKTKKTKMMKQLEIIQSPYTFVEAIRGDTKDPLYETYLREFESKIYPKNKYCLHKKHITPGSLGLLQSIFKTLTLFVESDLEHILILEDDAFTFKNFHHILFINEKLLKDKDLIYLGCHSSTDLIYKSNVNDKDVFIDVKTYKKLIYGAYSIILSKKIARHILNCGLESIVKLNLSWDLFLNHIRDNTDHTTFLYFKELFIPDVMKDGIQPQRSMEFYKKNNMNLDNYVYVSEPEPLP